MRGALILPLVLVFSGCVGERAGPGPIDLPPSAFRLSSAAFTDGEEIPQVHTCDGDNVSPPLRFTGAPNGTASLALIVGDPDAPVPQFPIRNVTHWLVWNITAEAANATFEEGAVPPGAVQGNNVAGRPQWTGPCPPPGSPEHRYMFSAFALDTTLDLPEGAERDALEDAIQGHALAEALLVGLYQRAVPPI
ncbi:MAG: YbhB/YbcL family Raf kinase inhibitor-like protein [Methanobacteriota archaeon]